MTYDFRNLSPPDFEELTRDLLQAEHGVRFESFAVGRDRGIDLRYSRSNERPDIIVQCKHFAASGWPKLLRHLKEEAAKVGKLAPKRYILTTSVSMTPDRKDEIVKLFSPYILSPADVVGAEDMNRMLRDHPRECGLCEGWSSSRRAWAASAPQ